MRRAVGGALDATVGRVSERVTETARGLTDSTARQVVDDLEPYLIAETVPRIIDGVRPYLADHVVPGMMDELTEHMTKVTVPGVMDGVREHLVEVTVPQVMAGLTPQLVDELLPALLVELRPYLAAELVPQIVDGLMPHLVDSVAPQLIDGLMPKIRAEVVPTVLDDIVDDPKVRQLIRGQSQGLIIDAIESFRATFANGDDALERFIRKAARKPQRSADLRPGVEPRPGRRYVNSGLVTRFVSFGADVALVTWALAQGVNSLIGMLDGLLDPTPPWLVALLALLATFLAPVYFAVCWWLAGRTLADWLLGLRMCTPDGGPIGVVRAVVRAWVGLVLLPVWLAGMVTSLWDPARRGPLDALTGLEVRYSVNRLAGQGEVAPVALR